MNNAELIALVESFSDEMLVTASRVVSRACLERVGTSHDMVETAMDGVAMFLDLSQLAPNIEPVPLVVDPGRDDSETVVAVHEVKEATITVREADALRRKCLPVPASVVGNLICDRCAQGQLLGSAGRVCDVCHEGQVCRVVEDPRIVKLSSSDCQALPQRHIRKHIIELRRKNGDAVAGDPVGACALDGFCTHCGEWSLQTDGHCWRSDTSAGPGPCPGTFKAPEPECLTCGDEKERTWMEDMNGVDVPRTETCPDCNPDPPSMKQHV